MYGRTALALLLLVLLHLTCAQEEKCAEGDEECPACVDLDDDCEVLAADGHCLSNPAFMTQSCRATCGWCKIHAVSTNHVVSGIDDVDDYQ